MCLCVCKRERGCVCVCVRVCVSACVCVVFRTLPTLTCGRYYWICLTAGRQTGKSVDRLLQDRVCL